MGFCPGRILEKRDLLDTFFNDKVKVNILEKTAGKYDLVLLVRNGNPTRLLDKMQLFFSQKYTVNSSLENKWKDCRKLGDQERKRNTVGG